MKKFSVIEWIAITFAVALVFVASYPVVVTVTSWLINGTENSPVEIRMKMFDLVNGLWGAVIAILTMLFTHILRRKDESPSPPTP